MVLVASGKALYERLLIVYSQNISQKISVECINHFNAEAHLPLWSALLGR
jgi:hypothetical protein